MSTIYNFPAQRSHQSRFDWTHYLEVPDHTRGALERYVFDHLEPGGFLTSVLSNDLMGAVGRADSQNVMALKEICSFIYNEIPSDCWGSPKKVANWLDKRA